MHFPGFLVADVIGIGAGGYFGFAQGTIDSSLNGTPYTQYSYETQFLNKTDYGLVLDARVKIPVAPMLGILIDARYNLGLANLSNSTSTYTNDTFYNRQAMFLVGLGIDL